MAMTVCPVTQNFAAEIGDVDLSAPLQPSDVQAIKDAFAKYAVLIFPDQQLSQDQHLDFARYFGPPVVAGDDGHGFAGRSQPLGEVGEQLRRGRFVGPVETVDKNQGHGKKVKS